MLFDYSHLCSVKNSRIYRQRFLLVLGLALLAASCKNQDVVPGELLVIHEIYQVTGDEQSKKPTVLKYKDAKLYKKGLLEQTTFFEIDNTVKSYEFVQKDGDSGITNYYDADSSLLAIYNIEYKGTNIVKRMGYEGHSKELLRTESFEYDHNGNVIKKSIFDNKGQLSSFFKMDYDNDANEISFSRHRADGQMIDEETFVISEKNERGEWLERWGYRNDMPSSFHRRSFSE